MELKTYTINDIRGLRPCYDPTRYLPEEWQGTALDVLQVAACPAEDRLWVVKHWLDDRTLRLFAVWCARQALALVAHPDPRSVTACDVAERFANGSATRAELSAAYAAAAAAAYADAAAAAAADAAAYAAADAAYAAAAYADAYAADAYADAAAAAARRNARRNQIAHLIEILA